MNPVDRKLQEVLAYERRFAFKLGEHVLEKPKMSVWMILIPVIIVYHVFRFKKYVTGRNKFARNYMEAREQALDVARSVVAEGKPRHVDSITARMSLPAETRGPYHRLLSVLVDHYVDLLGAEGEDIDSLLRRAYRSRADYLLFFNQLAQAEKNLHAALRPHLDKGGEEIEEAILRIQEISEHMRREEASRVFSRRREGRPKKTG